MTSAVDRVAAATISWDVCEVPDGEIDNPDRVLREMREVVTLGACKPLGHGDADSAGADHIRSVLTAL